jgi:hypothetical protein
MFRAQRVEARIANGQYTLTEVSAGKPAPDPRFSEPLPEGTLSTMFEVYREDTKIAVVHAMVGPNGEYLGSGHLDPKSLLVGNTLYYTTDK